MNPLVFTRWPSNMAISEPVMHHSYSPFVECNGQNFIPDQYTKSMHHICYGKAIHTPQNTAIAATSVSNAELCVLALGNPPAEGGPDHTRPKKSLLLRSLFHMESALSRMKSRKLS